MENLILPLRFEVAAPEPTSIRQCKFKDIEQTSGFEFNIHAQQKSLVIQKLKFRFIGKQIKHAKKREYPKKLTKLSKIVWHEGWIS